MKRRWLTTATLVAMACLMTAACNGSDDSGGASTPEDTLVVYSGREQEIVEPLFAQFEEETGIDLEVRYGDSAELAATLAEEGDASPADVYFAQDAGSLGAVADEGLLVELPAEALERVDARFRDPDGRWVGTSGRARVLAYNTDALSEDDLPSSVFELGDPAWNGKVGFPPTNGSFQAFVSAMRLVAGDDRTREWLEAIAANDPKLYEGNSQVIEALATGEIEVGLVNHYYLFLLKAEQPDAPVANHYLENGDPGALVNVAGVGIVAGADHPEAARAFVDFLLSDAGQRFYSERAEEAEYPLVAGIEPREGLPPIESLQGPDVSLGELGGLLESTLEMISEAGPTS